MDLLDIFCEFKPDTNKDTYICKLCNNRMVYASMGEDLPKIPCIKKLSKPIEIPKQAIKKPRIFKKIANFIKALFSHVLSGAKRTSLEERTQRLNICTACEYYDGIACTQCGCPITRYQQYLSKLDWKDQKCPVGKW